MKAILTRGPAPKPCLGLKLHSARHPLPDSGDAAFTAGFIQRSQQAEALSPSAARALARHFTESLQRSAPSPEVVRASVEAALRQQTPAAFAAHWVLSLRGFGMTEHADAVASALSSAMREVTAAFKHVERHAYARDVQLDALILGFGPIYTGAQAQKAIDAFTAEHQTYARFEQQAARLGSLLEGARVILARGGTLADKAAQFGSDALAKDAARLLEQTPRLADSEGGLLLLRRHLERQSHGHDTFLRELGTAAQVLRKSELRNKAARALGMAACAGAMDIMGGEGSATEKLDALDHLLRGLAKSHDLFGVPRGSMETIANTLRKLARAQDIDTMRKLAHQLRADAQHLEGESLKVVIGLGLSISVPLVSKVKGLNDDDPQAKLKAVKQMFSLGLKVVRKLGKVFGRVPGVRTAGGVTGVLSLIDSTMSVGKAWQRGLPVDVAYHTANLGLRGTTFGFWTQAWLTGDPTPGAVGWGVTAADLIVGHVADKVRSKRRTQDAVAFHRAAGVDAKLLPHFSKVSAKGHNVGFFVAQLAEHLGVEPAALVEKLKTLDGAKMKKFMKASKMRTSADFHYATSHPSDAKVIAGKRYFGRNPLEWSPLGHPMSVPAAAEWLRRQGVL